MPQDRQRKQTKKSKIEEIGKQVDKTLRDNFIRNLVQGGEICAQNILDMIEKGGDINDVVKFCESLLKVEDKTWIGEKEKEL